MSYLNKPHWGVRAPKRRGALEPASRPAPAAALGPASRLALGATPLGVAERVAGKSQRVRVGSKERKSSSAAESMKRFQRLRETHRDEVSLNQGSGIEVPACFAA